MVERDVADEMAKTIRKTALCLMKEQAFLSDQMAI